MILPNRVIIAPLYRIGERRQIIGIPGIIHAIAVLFSHIDVHADYRILETILVRQQVIRLHLGLRGGIQPIAASHVKRQPD